MAKAFKTTTVEHTPEKPLSAKNKRALAFLAALPDDQITTTPAPDPWGDAIRGVFYLPEREDVSIILHADIAAWLNEQGKNRQRRANTILRERMLLETRKSA